MQRSIVLAWRAYKMIEEDCLDYRTTETGGILLGRKTEDSIVVPFVISGGPKARRSMSAFAPDSHWQQPFLNYFFTRFGVDFVGDWHRHPGSFDSPSMQDRRTARRIVTDEEWDLPEAVFPIAVVNDGSIRLRGYLMTRSTPEFVEIPIKVVSDTDERMRNTLVSEEDEVRRMKQNDKGIAALGREAGAEICRRLRRFISCVRQGKII